MVLRRRACVQILFGYLGYFWKFGLGPGASRRKLQGLHRNGRAGRDDRQRRPAVNLLAKLIVAEFRKRKEGAQRLSHRRHSRFGRDVDPKVRAPTLWGWWEHGAAAQSGGTFSNK